MGIFRYGWIEQSLLSHQRFARGVLLFFLFSLWGCQPPVGGRCQYQEQLGSVEVIKTVEGDMVGVFSPARGSVGNDTEGLELPAPSQVSLFRFYPARLSVRTEGSCTPFFIDLISDDKWSQGLAIPLDDEGRETALTRDRTKEVAAMFSMLLPDRPNARLLILGHGSLNYSAEYRRNLANTYEERFKGRFLDLGLSPDQVALTYGILPDHFIPPAGPEGNGVQVFFVLEP